MHVWHSLPDHFFKASSISSTCIASKISISEIHDRSYLYTQLSTAHHHASYSLSQSSRHTIHSLLENNNQNHQNKYQHPNHNHRSYQKVNTSFINAGRGVIPLFFAFLL